MAHTVKVRSCVFCKTDLHEGSETDNCGCCSRGTGIWSCYKCGLMYNDPPQREITLPQIIINGKQRTVDPGPISYDQLVEYAHGWLTDKSGYGLVYAKGPPSKPYGALCSGMSVEAVDGMCVTVVLTNNA